MLYSLLISLVDTFSFLNVFKYLTVRTGLAMFTSMIVVFIIGTPFKFLSNFFFNLDDSNLAGMMIIGHIFFLFLLVTISHYLYNGIVSVKTL